MPILLWGVSTEGAITAVREELRHLGAPTLMLDQRDVLDSAIDYWVGADIQGWLRVGDCRVDLGAVTAMYLRPYDTRRLPSVAAAGIGSPAWQHAIAFDEGIWIWSEITPALVVNRLGAMSSNDSKPYQLACIRRLGFSVPDTLVTTDPCAAQAFWERHRDVIYKSISGVRSQVARLLPEHAGRLADLAACPTQFQQYIPGRDHRVHVVGAEIFASEIITAATDYRYAGAHGIEIRACRIPAEVADRCRQLAAALQLPVVGIDLRQTPDGEWYCFEANPSPAFTFYQAATGQPIGAAIARLLAAG